jgi:hypothetical protein
MLQDKQWTQSTGNKSQVNTPQLKWQQDQRFNNTGTIKKFQKS